MKNKSKKYVVRVAWSREANNLFDEKGWKALSDSDESHDFVEFDTEAEALAYAKGIDDSSGWIEPYCEIFATNSNKPI